jgi:sec-independent protein translocase protein TatB
MSSGELLVIVIVALVVFGPNKLPMLARHLGHLFGKFNQMKQQADNFWKTQRNEQQLRDNQLKAEQAEAKYRNSEGEPH